MELHKVAGILRFGAFELDRSSGELRKSGLKIHLREQPFRILVMLLDRPGEIITREEIQNILWPNDTVVEFEHSINAAIKALRVALGDDADNPRFVETLPRRGYRFIAPVSSTGVPPVELVGPGLAPASIDASGSPDGGKRPTQGSALQRVLPWALAMATIAAIVFAIISAHYMLQPKTEESAIRFSISPPENRSFGYYTGGTYSGGFSLSPDGRRLAFLTGTLNPWIGTQIWVRSLDDLAAKPLSGTEGALYPFWSPDGNYLGFIADGKLKKVEVAGGTPQTLCDAVGEGGVLTQEGGTWNREGVILFVSHGSLYRVSEAGGVPALVAEPDAARKETYYYLPQFLPDGLHFLVFAASRSLGIGGAVRGGSIKVGSLDSKRTNVLLQAGSTGMYTAPGYLLYLRDAILMARRFDAKRLRFTAEAVPIAENIGFDPVGGSYYSASQNGVLAYQTGGYGSGADNQMVWFGRRGEKLGNVGQTGSYTNPALSPDGTKLAVGLRDPKLNTRDIWVDDLERGTSSRLTFNPADDFAPVWSRDGSRIMFSSERKGQRDIYQKPAKGLGATESVFESKQQRKSMNDSSPDGRYIVFSTFENAVPLRSLWVLPLFGERTPYTIVQGRSYVDSAQFSPNGRYVAYSADETGRPEIYVQTFPERGGKWQVSTGGGIEPMWRRDGKELFYLSLDNKVMAVDVKTDLAQFEGGAQKPLFQVQLIPGGWRNRYVVSPDGQRFLMIVPAGDAKPSPITVVVNWPALLQK
ncbi:MAG TPA: winged helix-turn-helix domain-containing protein [Terriglobia bacterium]|nr:winged helix-turn-helix domain-containing protein [Terriglobia bacterium]